MKHLLTFLMLFSFFPAVTAQSTPYFPEEMIVTADNLNMRVAPGKNSAKSGSLIKGTVVQFVEAWNNGEYVQLDTTDENSPFGPWLKVRAGNKTGWVFGSYLNSTTGLYYEESLLFEEPATELFNWYGVYRRDSFADELRAVKVTKGKVTDEFTGQELDVLKTDQEDASKFLIASRTPLKTGYCGPMGFMDVEQAGCVSFLNPGTQFAVYPGNDLNDTLIKPAYGIAVTGCAELEGMMTVIKNFSVKVLDYATEPLKVQNLTQWLTCENPEDAPIVEFLWFGDIDRDNKPDIILQDCPYAGGCRASLYLSSRAKPDELLHKVCEHFWPGE
ncbi:MAG: SH3 domain-containing protein [Bacteroidota bacterium]